MGYGLGLEHQRKLNESKDLFKSDPLKGMKAHPNYEGLSISKGETKTAFILRSVAHLISPPQFDGESYDIECVDIKKAVLSFEKELEQFWKDNSIS